MNHIEEAAFLKEKLSEAQYVLIGIGGEWRITGALSHGPNEVVREGYDRLYELVGEKDYFIVTTLTDGGIYESRFDRARVTAPCGNIHWRQCSRACTKDIWEEGEVLDGICPHCGAALTENTIQAEPYIEEGYLPSWREYRKWLTRTLNRSLVVLELGEGFLTPTVIRWPFEKTVFFNQKSWLFRINAQLFQTPSEIKERSVSVAQQSAAFISSLYREDEESHDSNH